MRLQGILCGCFTIPRERVDVQPELPLGVLEEVVLPISVPKQELPAVDGGEPPCARKTARDSASSIPKLQTSRGGVHPGVDYQYGLSHERAPLSSRAKVGGTEYDSFFVNPLAEGSHEGGDTIAYAGAALGAVSTGLLGVSHHNPLAAEYSGSSASSSRASAATGSPMLVRIRMLPPHGISRLSGCAYALNAGVCDCTCPASPGTPLLETKVPTVGAVASSSDCSEHLSSLQLPTGTAEPLMSGLMAHTVKRCSSGGTGSLAGARSVAEAEDGALTGQEQGQLRALLQPSREACAISSSGTSCLPDGLPRALAQSPRPADECARSLLVLAGGGGTAAAVTGDSDEPPKRSSSCVCHVVDPCSGSGDGGGCGSGFGGSAQQVTSTLTAAVKLDLWAAAPLTPFDPTPPHQLRGGHEVLREQQLSVCTAQGGVLDVAAAAAAVAIASTPPDIGWAAPDTLAPCTPPLLVRDGCGGNGSSAHTPPAVPPGSRESRLHGHGGERQVRSDGGNGGEAAHLTDLLPHLRLVESSPPPRLSLNAAEGGAASRCPAARLETPPPPMQQQRYRPHQQLVAAPCARLSGSLPRGSEMQPLARTVAAPLEAPAAMAARPLLVVRSCSEAEELLAGDAALPPTPSQEVEQPHGEAARTRNVPKPAQSLPACLHCGGESQQLHPPPAVSPLATVTVAVAGAAGAAGAHSAAQQQLRAACQPAAPTCRSRLGLQQAASCASPRASVAAAAASSISSSVSVYLPAAPAAWGSSAADPPLHKRGAGLSSDGSGRTSAGGGGGTNRSNGERSSSAGYGTRSRGSSGSSSGDDTMDSAPPLRPVTPAGPGPARRTVLPDPDPGCSISGLAMTRQLIRQLGLLPPGTPLAFDEQPSPPSVSPFAAAFTAAEAALHCEQLEVASAAALPIDAQSPPDTCTASRGGCDDRDTVSIVCTLALQPGSGGSRGSGGEGLAVAAGSGPGKTFSTCSAMPIVKPVGLAAANETAAGGCLYGDDEELSSLASTCESSALFDERGCAGWWGQVSARSMQSWLEPQGWRPLREKFCTGGGRQAIDGAVEPRVFELGTL